jgi:hypothetical protein
MFHARKKLAGYRLVATDTTWNAGHGQEVGGPISALLLLLTGRPAALARLSGAGAAALQERTPSSHRISFLDRSNSAGDLPHG